MTILRNISDSREIESIINDHLKVCCKSARKSKKAVFLCPNRS